MVPGCQGGRGGGTMSPQKTDHWNITLYTWIKVFPYHLNWWVQLFMKFLKHRKSIWLMIISWGFAADISWSPLMPEKHIKKQRTKRKRMVAELVMVLMMVINKTENKMIDLWIRVSKWSTCWQWIYLSFHSVAGYEKNASLFYTVTHPRLSSRLVWLMSFGAISDSLIWYRVWACWKEKAT